MVPRRRVRQRRAEPIESAASHGRGDVMDRYTIARLRSILEGRVRSTRSLRR